MAFDGWLLAASEHCERSCSKSTVPGLFKACATSESGAVSLCFSSMERSHWTLTLPSGVCGAGSPGGDWGAMDNSGTCSNVGFSWVSLLQATDCSGRC